MAKVYVSSTYLDLQEHRRQAELALRRLGHVDVAMEYYTAEDRPARERCLADVAACDLYIGVFAWRHGWVPEDDNPDRWSITEMEFRTAVKSNRPCLIFLLDGKASWPPDWIDDDRTRIRKLRDELAGRYLVAYFSTPQDLAAAVTQAVARWEREDAATVEFSHYFDVLRRRYRRVDLDALTPPQREEYLQLELRSIFVEQNVRRGTPPAEAAATASGAAAASQESEVEEARRAHDIYDEEPRPVLGLIAEQRSRLIVILGNPGSGKSTLARYLLLTLADPDTSPARNLLRENFDGFVPFLVELRSFVALTRSGRCETFVEYLEYLDKTEGWRLGEHAVGEYLQKAGKAFVIFDGLDEIFDPAERERVMQQIVMFGELYPGAKLIVTSRVVGYRRRILSEAGFQHATLQDLDEAQVEAFIDRWYQLAISDRPEEARDRRERLMRSFRDSASIRQLAGNPLLLTIMAIIGKHQELPRERWKLYDHAASVLIQHWDVNKHLSQARVEADLIDEEDRKQLLRRLAFQMQGAGGGPAGNYIDRDKLQAVFAGYLEERYRESPVRAAAVARAMIEQFRERNFILSLYGAGLYGFVHRAFLEYFCASAYVFRFEKTHEFTVADLMSLFRERWPDQSWHEVLRLICGMIGEKFAGEIVESLLAADGEWVEKREPWNVALAVRCLGEIRNLGGVADTAGQALHAVYEAFDSPQIDRRFLRDELVRPAISIGPEWPACAFIADWIGSRRYRGHTWTDDQFFGSLVAATAKGAEACRRALEDYFTRRPVYYRTAAVSALAAGWRDDARTKRLLERLAGSDPDCDVRAAAVTALGQNFTGDPATFPVLRDRVQRDRSWMVRTAAVHALAEHFTAEPETASLFQERALQDRSEVVQSAAREALAEYFPRDAVTLSLLLDRRTRANLEGLLGGPVPGLGQLLELTATHADEFVRETILTILSQHFSNLPEVFPLVRDRAINDSRVVVRMCAIEALVQSFPEAPHTLPLLRARVRDDPHPWGREAALKALAERFPREPNTLELVRQSASEDPDAFVRGWAIDALRRYFVEDWRTVPFLCESLKTDPDGDVRRRAAGALRDFAYGDPRVHLALHHAWNYDPAVRGSNVAWWLDWGPRVDTETLAFRMERLANQPLDEYWKGGQDVRLLLERDARSHPRFSVRCAALVALAEEFGPLPELVAEILSSDPDPRVRVTALRLLEGCGGDGLKALLARAVEDADCEVRAEAVSLLAARTAGERPDRDWFACRLSSDPEPSVRRAAVYALGANLDDRGALECLCRCAAADSDARVRSAALECLSRSDAPEATACLEERSAAEPDPVARMVAREGAPLQLSDAELLVRMERGQEPRDRMRAADLVHRLCANQRGESRARLWSALCGASRNDPSVSARLGFLARAGLWFSDSRELQLLLEERAHADPDETVREFAGDLLAEGLW